MKTAIIGLMMVPFFAATIAFSQSSFELRNRNLFFGVDAPVFDSEGNPLEGPSYLAELWGGPTPVFLIPAVNDRWARIIVPFRSSGYFSDSTSAIITTVFGGAYAWLQVRAWDASLGATYEEAVALGLGGYGESNIFYAQGGNPLGVPPWGPNPLIGLESFSLLPVIPEPSTWFLLALGGGALFWNTRRKWRSTR